MSGVSEGRTFGASGGERTDQTAEEYTVASFLEQLMTLKASPPLARAVVGLRREINLNDVRIRRESITLADLSSHCQQRELVRGNLRIAYSMRKAYEGYLRKWIEPRRHNILPVARKLASRSESAGMLFVALIRRCFDLPAQS